ncbi:hypothetical protein MNAN1_003105 [Malassezia nana]|uniref:Uncharacterized protein n=1 Tax=Malassezia nana TaxID=180528 RepID=A0AAF0ELQ2_9BASI|nr:hypothetical protein MNAN1_003105 [Malassezia nana]
MDDYRQEAEERRWQRGLSEQDLEAGTNAGEAYPEAPQMQVPRTHAADGAPQDVKTQLVTELPTQ